MLRGEALPKEDVTHALELSTKLFSWDSALKRKAWRRRFKHALQGSDVSWQKVAHMSLRRRRRLGGDSTTLLFVVHRHIKIEDYTVSPRDILDALYQEIISPEPPHTTELSWIHA